MTAIRGIKDTFQDSPINKTLNIIVPFNSSYHPNMTSDKLIIAIDNSKSNYISEKLISEFINIGYYIIPSIIIIGLIIGLISYIQVKLINSKLEISKQIKWVRNIYSNYKLKSILPNYYHKKAKQSPYISAQPTPLTLPSCQRLDSVERGQNLQVRFSIPYRRYQSSDNLNTNEEHRITITTVVQKSPKMIPL